jgi:hypothetical protein
MPERKSQNRPSGYARVSTYGQTLDDVVRQLKPRGGVPAGTVQHQHSDGARRDAPADFENFGPKTVNM